MILPDDAIGVEADRSVNAALRAFLFPILRAQPMHRDLWEDEHEALLELAVVGPVRPGWFEHRRVTQETEYRLLEAKLIELEGTVYVITSAGRQALRNDSTRRTHGWQILEGGKNSGSDV